MKTPLQDLIDRYNRCSEFLGIEINDVNQQGALDDTLLHIVARIGSVEEVNLLVMSGAQVNAIGDLGYTPLHYAAMKGRIDIAKRLLDLGSSINSKNEFDETPADAADNGGHSAVANFLRSH